MSPAWSPPASTRARCRTRTWSPRPRTRPCAARAAASSLAKNASEELEKKLQTHRLPGHPGRAADARDRRQGGGLQGSAGAGVQGLPAAGGEERAGDGQDPDGARLQDRFRRHREPPDADRPDRPRSHRQGRRGRARQGAHHRQQERGAERPALALRHLRPAHRHAGRDHARLPRAGLRGAGRTGSATCSTPRATSASSPACARTSPCSAGTSRSTAESEHACIAPSASTKTPA